MSCDKKDHYGNKFAFSFLSGTLSGEWKVIAIAISLQKHMLWVLILKKLFQ